MASCWRGQVQKATAPVHAFIPIFLHMVFLPPPLSPEASPFSLKRFPAVGWWWHRGAAYLLFHEVAAADGKDFPRGSPRILYSFTFLYLFISPHCVNHRFNRVPLHLLCLYQEEQAAKLKAERIRVALEKIKEAQVKKV